MDLPIKVISTDFDGTVHGEMNDPPVPPRLQSLIGRLQKRGAKWIVNTGRDLPSVQEALFEAQITIQPDYLVVVEREIYHRNLLGYLPDLAWNSKCDEEHERLFAPIRKDMPQLKAWIQGRFKAAVFEDNYSPFCLVASNNADADAILDHVQDYCLRTPGLTIMRNDIYARFCHADFNKGTAMAEIARQLGVGRDFILAAGDHLNDLPMLSVEFARWLVAPANAVDAVKESVRRQQGFISPDPYGVGVAQGLEHILKATGYEL